MYIYHGIVDQETPRGVEYIFAVLPPTIEVGAAFIIFRYSGKDNRSSPDDTENYFEGEIESASTAQHEKSATYTCRNVRLQLARDGKALRVYIQCKPQTLDITSTMACIMEHPVIDAEALYDEPGLFFGPVVVNDSFYGNLIALVLSKKEGSSLEPARLCLCWDSKSVTSGNQFLYSPPTSVASCDNGITEVGQSPPQFLLRTDSHDIGATLKLEGSSLELMVRSLYDDPLSIQEWALVSIPVVEMPGDTLRNISAGTFLPQDQTVTVTNNWTLDKDPGEIVECTITRVESDDDKAGEDLNEFLTHAGLGLAAVGLLAGLPAFPAPLGMAIAIGGMPLAVKPWIETMFAKVAGLRGSEQEKSAILYPGDKMQLYYFGKVPQTFRIDMVRRTATIVDKRTLLKTIRYTSTSKTNDTEKDGVGRERKVDTSALTMPRRCDVSYVSAMFIDAPLKMVQRRLLFIEGLKVLDNDWTFSKEFPLALEGSSCISYGDNDKIDLGDAAKLHAGVYFPTSELSAASSFWWFGSDPNRKVAVVQSGSTLDTWHDKRRIGEVRYLPGPPFTPVLALKDTTIIPSDKRKRTDIGHDSTWEGTLAAIQTFEDEKKKNNNNKDDPTVWGYYWSSHSNTLWACPYPSADLSYTVSFSWEHWTYFPVRHWCPTTVLVKDEEEQ